MRIILLLTIVGGVTLFAPPRSPKVPSSVLSVGAQDKHGSDIRLQTIEQCKGEKLDHLTAADKDEIITLMLEDALTRKRIPSYSNLIMDNNALLSTVNIESQRVSNPAGLRVVLLSPGEIQARANRQGDLMYLEFGKFEPHGSCVAVSLSNLWADGTSTIETGPKTLLGEGCLNYVFYKRSGKWMGEFVDGWVS